ncbi:MAG TPA: hydrogenase maturation protease [Syntrophobacter fumaroxidans]|nr:hydrogenase maturation protease [Syntrophobacter fumaroxidans]
MYRQIRGAEVMVIGCGNVLFGDDGFGPAVIERLQTGYRLPDGMVAVDAGTAAGELLLDALLGDEAPRTLIIVDAMDLGLSPGTVEEIPLEAIPENKRADFSVHQFPAVDFLRELKERKGISLRLLGCQVESVPGEICPGLSVSVARSVGETAENIYRMVCKEVEIQHSTI